MSIVIRKYEKVKKNFKKKIKEEEEEERKYMNSKTHYCVPFTFLPNNPISTWWLGSRVGALSP
jgi:hypothetical protein